MSKSRFLVKAEEPAHCLDLGQSDWIAMRADKVDCKIKEFNLAISISNLVPVAQVPAVEDTPKAQTHAATVAAASTFASTDTVKLTQNAQIHALEQQGQAISEIANSLGVTVASVDSVLGVTVTQAAAPVVATTAGRASGSTTPEVVAAPAAPAAPVGVQAGPTPVAELNVAKG
jgi:hypothetical protein